MAADPPPAQPNGESPPLFVITSTDQGGVIIIVTALCIAISISSLLIRAYVRWEFTPRRFAWDDFWVALALVFSICQSATVFLEVRDGFGKTESEVPFTHVLSIQKAVYADEILYIIAVWLSKLSIVFLLLRLSPKSGHVRASRFNLAFVAITALICILLLALRCDLAQPWLSFDENEVFCGGLYARFQVLAAFDIVTEVFLFATAVYMITSLQMDLWKKFIILTAFAFRLLLIAVIALHLHYLNGATIFTNPTLQLTHSTLCKQIEICYAIVAATIPVLRPFMVALTTHYGALGNTSISTRSMRETNPSAQNRDPSSQKGSGATTTTGGRSKHSTNSWPSSSTRGNTSRLSQRVSANMEGVDSFGQYRADISSGQPEKNQMIDPESSITVRTDVELSIDYQDEKV